MKLKELKAIIKYNLDSIIAYNIKEFLDKKEINKVSLDIKEEKMREALIYFLDNKISIDDGLLITDNESKKGLVISKEKIYFLNKKNELDLYLPNYFNEYTNELDLIRAIKPMDININKYSRGKVIVIGGSINYSGAPLLVGDALTNALASLITYSGYVILYTKKELMPIAKKTAPHIVVKDLEDENELRSDIEKFDVISIGNGLEYNDYIKSLIDFMIKEKKKIIVDAGALDYFKKNIGNENVLITPHEGEFKRVFDIDVKNMKLKERIEITKRIAKRINSNIILKAHYSIITNGRQYKINAPIYNNLSTMGSGDVLSGIIAAFASIGNNLYVSSLAGTYLHSLIGDLLYKEKGMHISALDIIDKIPYILKNYDKIK